MAEAEFKSRILTLLEEDREFRMSVAGLVGYKEVLDRLAEHDRRFDEILARQEEHDRRFNEILATLREHSRRFEEHDRKFDEILATLHEHSMRFEEHSKLFDALDLKIQALGSRWGIFSEQAFREGMKNVVEQYFGGEVERWITDDEEGIVFGHPSKVEVDLIIKDGVHILVEIKSSIHKSSVSQLWREGRLYEEKKGITPKLAIISPFIEADAKEEAEFYGIALFTRTTV